LQTLEKRREEELGQARAIQSMMMHRRASPARLLARLFAAENFTGESNMTIWRRSFFSVVERSAAVVRFFSRNGPTALTATSSQGGLFFEAGGVMRAHATNETEQPSKKCWQNGSDAAEPYFVRTRAMA
jgi:hypothetical protein